MNGDQHQRVLTLKVIKFFLCSKVNVQIKIINKKVMVRKNVDEVKVLKAIKMLGKEIIKLVSYLNDQNVINLRHEHSTSLHLNLCKLYAAF